MLLTTTTSTGTQEQLASVEQYLAEFLPRLKQEPGVVEILHVVERERGEDSTFIPWESPEALARYRESALMQEAIAEERRLGMPATRTRAEVTLRLV